MRLVGRFATGRRRPGKQHEVHRRGRAAREVVVKKVVSWLDDVEEMVPDGMWQKVGEREASHGRANSGY